MINRRLGATRPECARSVGQFPEVPGVNHAFAVYHDLTDGPTLRQFP